MTKTDLYNGTWYQGDCLEVMKDIPDDSIDMILCDLPYGTTDCSWDTVIPFEPLWEQYHRIAKERAAIVLTASQPFTSALVMSNVKNFRHQWFWNKKSSANFLLAKFMPLKVIEDVLVFSEKSPIYNPIKTKGRLKNKGGGRSKKFVGIYGNRNENIQGNSYKSDTYFPKNLIEFSNADHNNKFHPTQKPVALFEYLIKTYTNENDLVLDNCAGSGTTAVSCENTKRKWICIEQDKTYSEKAIKRIKKNHIPNAFREI